MIRFFIYIVLPALLNATIWGAIESKTPGGQIIMEAVKGFSVSLVISGCVYAICFTTHIRLILAIKKLRWSRK